MATLVAPATQHVGRSITFFVALAVFAQDSTWNFYQAQVPALLREHIASAAVIGVLMGTDNVLGVFIQPWIGNRSDNTRTRWGRRIPYLAVGMPVAAALFAIIPFASSLPALIVVMFAYALVVNSFRPIGQALLPDFISPRRRSRANAIVMLASSLTIIFASLISDFLVNAHLRLSFAVPSMVMLASAVVLVWRVRDSNSSAYQVAVAGDGDPDRNAAPATRMREILAGIVHDGDHSRLLLILAIAMFGGAWAASRTLVTPYGMEVLGLSRGRAGGLTLFGGVTFVFAAFPVALLSERIGRLRVMALGGTLFAAALTVGTLAHSVTATVASLAICAIGAAGFMINGSVVLWNLAPSARTLGAYTGLYTVCWGVGGFLGPTLVGAMVDITGWRFVLIDASLLAVAGILAVLRIDHLQRLKTADAGYTL
jgi:MFS family permease